MKYDVIVIGSGPGGYVCAIRLSQLGKRVAVIEERDVGGTCLNRGCIPTKALLHAALIAREIKNGESFGISVSEFNLNFEKTKAWINQMVSKLRSGIEYLFKSYKIELIKGRASLISSHEISVKNEKLEAENIVIASGSIPLSIPSIQPNSRKIFTSDDIFNIAEFPKSLIILGGGAIGVEMATAFSYLGSEVTIIEMMDQLLPGFPKDLVHVVELSLRRAGVKILLNTKAENCEYFNDKLKIKLSNGDYVKGDYVLLAVGRRPNTNGLELVDLKLNEKGFIKVDESMRTNISGIFAIGDVTGLPFLAHKAMEEGYYTAEIIAGLRNSMPKLFFPHVIYSDPEIAIIGSCEGRFSKFPLAALGRLHTLGRTEGFIKIIYDEAKKIIGVQIVGHNASELIGEASLALFNSMSLEDLSEVVHPHPTLSEGLLEASRLGLKKCIHYKG
ncbi:MAG: dihydrolipoyl dehydrogenase [Candidatus Methanomethyliaceae archaeon]|nr:dihydrolipoyl dehydrogenase [Candidatus Methanomethyliaceae archaeon]MDW7970753.1 dihydrolipoyl dehydrogenase [Nitrososphaerota archaeon]